MLPWHNTGLPACPRANDDVGTASVGSSVVINVLNNDEYDTGRVVEVDTMGSLLPGQGSVVVNPGATSLTYTAPSSIPAGGSVKFMYLIKEADTDRKFSDSAYVTVTITGGGGKLPSLSRSQSLYLDVL